MNVLLIVVDQWRGDTLAHLGHPCVRTPNVSRLAARGVTFTGHYCQGVPCAPARASLLTGTYPMTHRVVRNGTPLDARLATLASVTRAAGLDPALTGYTTTAPDPRETTADDPRYETHGDIMDGWRQVRPFAPAKRPYFGWLSGQGYDVPEPPEQAWNPQRPGQVASDGPLDLPLPIAPEHTDTAWFTDGALEHIRAHAGRPWFLHYGVYRPHPPFVAAAPYLAHYPWRAMPAPVRAATPAAEGAQHPLLAHYLGRIDQSKFFENRHGPVAAMGEDEVRQTRAQYYALVTEVDHHIGRVLDLLERSGEAERTLVVFTSDHAEQLGNHWMLGKQGYFRDSYHIPLIVVDPRPDADATRGRVVDAFTESVDVMPTILEWLGLEAPRQCDGVSLLPWLHGGAPEQWRRGVFYEFDFREVMDPVVESSLGVDLDACGVSIWQERRFKHVHFTGLPPLLFDLAADPHELHDLAGSPAHRDPLLAITQRHLSHRMAHANRTLTGYCAGDGLHHRGARDDAPRRLGQPAVHSRRR